MAALFFFQAENLNDDIERIKQNIEHFESEEVRTERERQNIIRRIEVRTWHTVMSLILSCFDEYSVDVDFN